MVIRFLMELLMCSDSLLGEVSRALLQILIVDATNYWSEGEIAPVVVA